MQTHLDEIHEKNKIQTDSQGKSKANQKLVLSMEATCKALQLPNKIQVKASIERGNVRC